MTGLSFDWDEHKNQINVKKHDVSFEEAITVFYDEKAVEFYDDTAADFEDRFLLLGFSAKLRMLILCYCMRCDDSVIRIISARKATKTERKHYGRV